MLGGEKTPAFDDDVWELYDTEKDWSQANHLSKQFPDKLHELQRLFLIEATKYNVLPLDDRAAERTQLGLADWPRVIKEKRPLFNGVGRLSENCVLNIKDKSHAVSAEVVVPKSGVDGVIIEQGGNIGGWSLYAKTAKLKCCYTWTACRIHSHRHGAAMMFRRSISLRDVLGSLSRSSLV